MGLDQYGYAIRSDGERLDLQTWRKHSDLQGWMEQLWETKGRPNPNNRELDDSPFGSAFNCLPLELTEDDLAALHQAVTSDSLPHTQGFFFGASLPEDKDLTLEFIKFAFENLKKGNRVFYDSWW
jgi:hypothetical protein